MFSRGERTEGQENVFEGFIFFCFGAETERRKNAGRRSLLEASMNFCDGQNGPSAAEAGAKRHGWPQGPKIGTATDGTVEG